MEPTAAPMLSILPLSPTTADGLESLQNDGFFAENAADAPNGLFASLLGQLTVEQPAAETLLPEATAVLPMIAPVIAAEVLPPAGNVLPQVIRSLDAESQIRPLVSEAVTDSVKQAGALLPSQLTQQPPTVRIEQVVGTATTTSSEPAAAASVIAAVVGNPVLAKPLTTVKTLTTDQARLQHTVAAEQKISTDPLPAPVATVAKEFPLELAQQSGHQQPSPIMAPDNPGAFITTNPTTAQPAATTTTSPASLTLNHPIADARWGDSLGQRVMWMTENGMGRAEIRLNPPELGPLHVQVSVTNDEAKVAFSVQNGTTRELVEAALPRLREMFAQQGIELTDANVSQHSPDDQRQAGGTGDSSHDSQHRNAQVTGDMDEVDTIAANQIVREGLIDAYV